MERSEYETTITYDTEEKVVRIFSAVKRDQSRLKKAGITPTYGNNRGGFGYKVPLSQFRWSVRATGQVRRVRPDLRGKIPGKRGKVGVSEGGC